MENSVSRVLLNSFPACHFLGFRACCRFFSSSSIHPELLKSVVIPSMTVNLGLQLSTAQSHLLVFLTPRGDQPCLFLCFLTWFTSWSMTLQSFAPRNLTLKGGRMRRGRGVWGGVGVLRWWILKKSRLPSSTERELFIWICIQVRVLFTGEAKGREGYLSFPSCTSSRTQIGTEGWAVSPGISILPFAWLPPRETCQRLPFTAAHMPVVFSNITQDPREQHIRPPRSWPATTANELTSSCFSCSFIFPRLLALTCQWLCGHCRSHSGCPEKRLWKQLLADEKFMQRYHIFEYPRLIIAPSLPLCLSFWMMHRWHTSHCSTRVWGLFFLWSTGEFLYSVLSKMDQTIWGGEKQRDIHSSTSTVL